MSERTIEDYVAEVYAKQEAQHLERQQAERLRTEQQSAAFGEAMRKVAVSCGVRPQQVEDFASAHKAHELFELREGRVVAKEGVYTPGDPLQALDVAVWCADLRDKDLASGHPAGGVWWEK